MNLFNSIIFVIKRRPFYLLKYGWETFLFTFNHFYWKVFSHRGVKIGENLHVLATFCFKAEKPNSKIEVGNNFVAYYDCDISSWDAGRVKIGDYCSLGSGTRIDCRETITIGSHVLISWDVLIADYDPHPLDPAERVVEMEYSFGNLLPRFSAGWSGKSEYTPRFVRKPVVIEDDVWIGARAIIMKGVRIGRGSVIGSGAIVTHDVPPNSVAVGNPAKVVKTLS